MTFTVKGRVFQDHFRSNFLLQCLGFQVNMEKSVLPFPVGFLLHGGNDHCHIAGSSIVSCRWNGIRDVIDSDAEMGAFTNQMATRGGGGAMGPSREVLSLEMMAGTFATRLSRRIQGGAFMYTHCSGICKSPRRYTIPAACREDERPMDVVYHQGITLSAVPSRGRE